MAHKSRRLVGNGPEINLLNMRRWSHKEIEVWAQRCERCLELISGDFGLAADGAAPDFCWKMLKNKKKKMKWLIDGVKRKIS